MHTARALVELRELLAHELEVQVFALELLLEALQLALQLVHKCALLGHLSCLAARQLLHAPEHRVNDHVGAEVQHVHVQLQRAQQLLHQPQVLRARRTYEYIGVLRIHIVRYVICDCE